MVLYSSECWKITYRGLWNENRRGRLSMTLYSALMCHKMTIMSAVCTSNSPFESSWRGKLKSRKGQLRVWNHCGGVLGGAHGLFHIFGSPRGSQSIISIVTEVVTRLDL